jgi:hypothetical protein
MRLRRIVALALAAVFAAIIAPRSSALADNELASVQSTFYVIAPGNDSSAAPIVDAVVTRLQELFNAGSGADPVWVVPRLTWAPGDLASQCINDPSKGKPSGPHVLGGLILDGTNTYEGGPDSYILWSHGWAKLKTSAQLVSCAPLGYWAPTITWNSNGLNGYGSRNGFPLETIAAAGILGLSSSNTTGRSVAFGTLIGNLGSTNALPTINESDEIRDGSRRIANDLVQKFALACKQPPTYQGRVIAAAGAIEPMCARLGIATTLPALPSPTPAPTASPGQ